MSEYDKNLDTNNSDDEFIDIEDEFEGAPQLTDDENELLDNKASQQSSADNIEKDEKSPKPAKPGKKSSGKASSSSTNKDVDSSSDIVPVVQLAIPDILFKRLSKGLKKNQPASSYIVSLLREFMLQPDWLEQVIDTFENTELEYAKTGLSRKLSPTISVYSKAYRQVVRKVAKVLNTNESLITYIIIDLQLQKGGVKQKKGKVSAELLGPVEI